MISCLPTSAPGVVLEPFFFQSKSFVDAVREDVSNLISKFIAAWRESDNRTNISAFALFKGLWRSTGWIWVHLNTIEPTVREAWWDTVARCFTDRLMPDAPPDLSHIAALFAIYTLAFSQPTHPDSPLLGIKLSISQLQHLKNLPHIVAESSKAVEDVCYIISQILTAPADSAIFYVIPDVLQGYPSLPTSHIAVKDEGNTVREVGKLNLGLDAELSTLADQVKGSEEDIIDRDIGQSSKRMRLEYELHRDGLKGGFEAKLNAAEELYKSSNPLVAPLLDNAGLYGQVGINGSLRLDQIMTDIRESDSSAIK